MKYWRHEYQTGVRPPANGRGAEGPILSGLGTHGGVSPSAAAILEGDATDRTEGRLRRTARTAPRPYELGRRTALGYRTFRCRACKRTSNARTGTAFNHLEYPTDVVLLVVRWRLQYSLSLRDLATMFLERGIVFTHEAAREWEAGDPRAGGAPLLAERLRARRKGKAGRKWYGDETYGQVHGRPCYLYRAIDRDGNLVDSMLSEHRDMDAARRFFAQAIGVVGHGPVQVTTDGHAAYPRAIRETAGEGVEHRCSRYLHNRLQQDHRDIRQGYHPMRGFGSAASTSRFCSAFDKVRDLFARRGCRASYSSFRRARVRLVQRCALPARVEVREGLWYTPLRRG